MIRSHSASWSPPTRRSHGVPSTPWSASCPSIPTGSRRSRSAPTAPRSSRAISTRRCPSRTSWRPSTSSCCCETRRPRSPRCRAPEEFVRSTVKPLAAYGPPRDPAAVPLHLNESPSDVPAELKREMSAQLQAMDWSKYPITDGQGLAADFARAYGVDPAGVLVGNGSNELLQLLLFACIEPGDSVVVAAPSFALYALQAKALGARVLP